MHGYTGTVYKYVYIYTVYIYILIPPINKHIIKQYIISNVLRYI